MIYYTNLPSGDVLSKITLTEIREFLGAPYYLPGGMMHGPVIWGRARLWEVVRRTPYRNAVPTGPLCGMCGNVKCRC